MTVASPPANSSTVLRSAQAASTITPVAWIPTRDMDIAEWTRAGQRLGAMGRCGQWGLGDWIRYGNVKFGERYAVAAKITGYDVQTLMNMVYVATKFEISRRREKLSWSHHETVASLEPLEQDRWLDLAIEKKLSIADLRHELRFERRNGAEARSQDDCAQTEDKTELVTCPKCGYRIELA